MSWGQASHLQEGVGDCEDVHRLIDELTNIRVRVCWPQMTGKAAAQGQRVETLELNRQAQN